MTKKEEDEKKRRTTRLKKKIKTNNIRFIIFNKR